MNYAVPDPRRTDGATLDVDFEIESYGSSASPGYDAGCPWDSDGESPEISLESASDFTGADVLPLLSEADRETIETYIIEHFDFDPGDDDPRWD